MRRLFNRATKILLSMNSMVLIAVAMLGPFYTLFVENLGGNLINASLSVAIFAFVAGMTVLLSGKYINKIKEKELIVALGYTLMGIGFTLYIFVDTIIFLFLVQILVGFASSFYLLAFDDLYAKHATSNRVKRLVGNFEPLDYFTMSIGSIIGGVVVEFFGFEMLFILMAAFCFSSALYIFFLPRRVL